ncbi:MAG: hypothetical protein V4508_17195 [Pseudomonadota bacterium]
MASSAGEREATFNYSGRMDNTLFKNDPHGCKLASFTTVDLTAPWNYKFKPSSTTL